MTSTRALMVHQELRLADRDRDRLMRTGEFFRVRGHLAYAADGIDLDDVACRIVADVLTARRFPRHASSNRAPARPAAGPSAAGAEGDKSRVGAPEATSSPVAAAASRAPSRGPGQPQTAEPAAPTERTEHPCA